jgi:hypothetical protein
MLDRGRNVLRLGERLLGQMMKDTQVEQAEVQATKIAAGMEIKKFVRDTMARIEKSNARFSDIDLMLQIFFCRHYDNFEIFLEELLGDIVRSEPALLDGVKLRKADDGLPAAEKLERRIEKVARLPLSQLAETARDEMSFEIFTDQKVEQRLIYLSDVRNLLTHRHGIVDRHFAERHRESGLDVGKSLVVGMEFTRDAVGDMTRAAVDIQARAESRFKFQYKTIVSGQTEWWEESYLPELPPPHDGRSSD